MSMSATELLRLCRFALNQLAYAEAPDRNNNVRIALTPYTVEKYLNAD